MKRPDITPGPWSFTEGVHPAINAQQGWHTLHIAKIIYGFGPEIRANARAIAAVPALLEALELLVKESGRSLDELDPDISSHKPIIMAYSALIAAGYQF